MRINTNLFKSDRVILIGLSLVIFLSVVIYSATSWATKPIPAEQREYRNMAISLAMLIDNRFDFIAPAQYSVSATHLNGIIDMPKIKEDVEKRKSNGKVSYEEVRPVLGMVRGDDLGGILYNYAAIKTLGWHNAALTAFWLIPMGFSILIISRH